MDSRRLSIGKFAPVSTNSVHGPISPVPYELGVGRLFTLTTLPSATPIMASRQVGSGVASAVRHVSAAQLTMACK